MKKVLIDIVLGMGMIAIVFLIQGAPVEAFLGLLIAGGLFFIAAWLFITVMIRSMRKSVSSNGTYFTLQQAQAIHDKGLAARNQPVISEQEVHNLLLRTDSRYLWSHGDANTPGSMAFRNRAEKEQLAKKEIEKQTARKIENKKLKPYRKAFGDRL